MDYPENSLDPEEIEKLRENPNYKRTFRDGQWYYIPLSPTEEPEVMNEVYMAPYSVEEVLSLELPLTEIEQSRLLSTAYYLLDIRTADSITSAAPPTLEELHGDNVVNKYFVLDMSYEGIPEGSRGRCMRVTSRGWMMLENIVDPNGNKHAITAFPPQILAREGQT